jgi:hypothetical protein
MRLLWILTSLLVVSRGAGLLDEFDSNFFDDTEDSDLFEAFAVGVQADAATDNVSEQVDHPPKQPAPSMPSAMDAGHALVSNDKDNWQEKRMLSSLLDRSTIFYHLMADSRFHEARNFYRKVQTTSELVKVLKANLNNVFFWIYTLYFDHSHALVSDDAYAGAGGKLLLLAIKECSFLQDFIEVHQLGLGSIFLLPKAFYHNPTWHKSFQTLSHKLHYKLAVSDYDNLFPEQSPMATIYQQCMTFASYMDLPLLDLDVSCLFSKLNDSGVHVSAIIKGTTDSRQSWLIQPISEVLQTHLQGLNLLSTYKVFDEAFSSTLAITEQWYKNEKSEAYQPVIDRLKKNQATFIMGSLPGHVFCIVFHPKFLFIGNRNEGYRFKNVIRRYTWKPDTNLTVNDVRNLCHNQTLRDVVKKAKKLTMPLSSVVAKVYSGQRPPNCVFQAVKQGFWILLGLIPELQSQHQTTYREVMRRARDIVRQRFQTLAREPSLSPQVRTSMERAMTEAISLYTTPIDLKFGSLTANVARSDLFFWKHKWPKDVSLVDHVQHLLDFCDRFFLIIPHTRYSAVEEEMCGEAHIVAIEEDASSGAFGSRENISPLPLAPKQPLSTGKKALPLLARTIRPDLTHRSEIDRKQHKRLALPNQLLQLLAHIYLTFSSKEEPLAAQRALKTHLMQSLPKGGLLYLIATGMLMSGGYDFDLASHIGLAGNDAIKEVSTYCSLPGSSLFTILLLTYNCHVSWVESLSVPIRLIRPLWKLQYGDTDYQAGLNNPSIAHGIKLHYAEVLSTFPVLSWPDTEEWTEDDASDYLKWLALLNSIAWEASDALLLSGIDSLIRQAPAALIELAASIQREVGHLHTLVHSDSSSPSPQPVIYFSQLFHRLPA